MSCPELVVEDEDSSEVCEIVPSVDVMEDAADEDDEHDDGDSIIWAPNSVALSLNNVATCILLVCFFRVLFIKRTRQLHFWKSKIVFVNKPYLTYSQTHSMMALCVCTQNLQQYLLRFFFRKNDIDFEIFMYETFLNGIENDTIDYNLNGLQLVK
jgi:hypothetical protein